MKKIITLVFVLILLSSICRPVNATPIRFTDSDRIFYDVDGYHEHLWANFNRLFDYTPWQFLIQSELFAYQGFVRRIENDPILRTLLPLTGWITDENFTVNRSIEILANFIILMEYELNEVHNHMVEIDTLNNFIDYVSDFTGIVTSKLGGLPDLAFNAMNVVLESANDYRILSMMLLNYETSYNFLSVVIQYANNENLIEGARILRDNINRLMEYKLNYFNNVLERVGVFTGKDVFVDTILKELIENPEHLALNLVDQFALEKLYKGYSALNDVWTGINITRNLGVFIADMIGGISNVHNRVVEMQAMYDINQALIRSTENLRRNVYSGEDLNEIERVFQNMRYMMYVNARGDYLLYQMAMLDGHLLSFLFTDTQAIEEWYAIIQDAFMSLIGPFEYFWPEREWFRIENDFYNQAQQAYMEFLLQRRFESYVGEWWQQPIEEYAILNIHNDGVPILLIGGTGEVGARETWIFAYDVEQNRVVNISIIPFWVYYSETYQALVFRRSRGFAQMQTISYYMPDIWGNGAISFTVLAEYEEPNSFFEPKDGTYSIKFGNWFDDDRISQWYYISEQRGQNYWNGLIQIEFSPIPLNTTISTPQQNNSEISNNWIDWFSISFHEWFGDNPPQGNTVPMEGEHFRHPMNSEIILIFSHEFTTSSYPIVIDMPISSFMGRDSTSVEELKNLFGSEFMVSYGMLSDGGTGYSGWVVNDEFNIMFYLESPYDNNITRAWVRSEMN